MSAGKRARARLRADSFFRSAFIGVDPRPPNAFPGTLAGKSKGEKKERSAA